MNYEFEKLLKEIAFRLEVIERIAVCEHLNENDVNFYPTGANGEGYSQCANCGTCHSKKDV